MASLWHTITAFLLRLNLFGTVWLNPDSQSYEAIFSFGDSMTDNGNYIRSGVLRPSKCFRQPYGITFFNEPTGRCSDGRLIIDFFAEAYGLPYLTPYLGIAEGQNISQGVNFAVAGATALDLKFYEDQDLGQYVWTNLSLSVQAGWFQNIRPSLCTTKEDCASYFRKSLFLVGEIGGDDYKTAMFVGASTEQLEAMVPFVVAAIIRTTSVLIEEGAVNLVIPGNFPMGCMTRLLTWFQSTDKTKYDPRNGCLKAYNEISEFHNRHLENALVKLRQKYPHTYIVFADQYNATLRLINSPKEFGFTDGDALQTCCGGGGPYNYNDSATCGEIGSKACSDPSSYINWDGIHLTDAAYRLVAQGLIEGPYSLPPL